jgi:prevent-host-death family protein
MRQAVLTVSEARRRLPALLKQVASGQGPVIVGSRGKSLVALVDAGEYQRLRLMAATHVAEPTGWDGLRLEIVGLPADLDRAMAELREENARLAEGKAFGRDREGVRRKKAAGSRAPARARRAAR